jgi:hypothetical protein
MYQQVLSVILKSSEVVLINNDGTFLDYEFVDKAEKPKHKALKLKDEFIKLLVQYFLSNDGAEEHPLSFYSYSYHHLKVLLND